MKHILITLLLFMGLNASDRVRESIVKIYTVAKVPNYLIPWNTTIRRAHGSGSIIVGDRILTNAHVVANETFIEVKKYGDTKRYEAQVEFISHQSDLAILRVKDKEFFAGVKSLAFGTLPKLQEEVTVYGFPMGGNSLSVSKGIVSRIEHNIYAHSREKFLAIQIDAAVNPGNSGGPAMSDGEIVGVVMQHVSKGQSIGYLVPSEIIEHFLEDIKDGHYDGFGHLGIGTQYMENEALRTLYGMASDVTGIRVVDVSQKSTAYDVLKSGDILLRIDGHTIKNDATVEFIPEQYTSLMYFVDQKQIGESVKMDILRDSVKKSVEIQILNIADDDLLVNTVEHDVMPRYFIYGGYVFAPVSRNLLLKKASLELRVASTKWATKEKDEVVVLLKVLADKTNRGNHTRALWKIDTLNEESFKDYKTFKKMFKENKEKFIVLKNKDGEEIVIDTQKAQDATPHILKRYSIVNASSSEE